MSMRVDSNQAAINRGGGLARASVSMVNAQEVHDHASVLLPDEEVINGLHP